MNAWLKWTIFCALGELLGIGIAGGIAFVVNTTIGEPETFLTKLLVLLVMLLAGCIEGFLLGTFQWHVLQERFRKIPKREWVFYTVLVAVIGWFLGMLPSLFIISGNTNSVQDTTTIDFEHPLLLALLSVASGLVLGAVFGLFQWFVLKKYVHKAYKWITANALGWGLGLGWIYLFASFPNENTSLIFNILTGISGGLLAGLSVGAVTGAFLLRLEEK
jgi:uncharacterized integral membrane protein